MRKIFILLFCIISLGSFGQQDFIMYGLNNIPQSRYNNPANRFEGKFYIGLPGISSNYFSFGNSGFAYSDVVKKDGDSLLLDFNSLLSEVEDQNYMSFSTEIDILSFGITLSDRTQLMVNITEKVNFRFSYPKDFMELIYKGNGGFGGQTARFDGIGLSMNHYREYGIGVSHLINDQLSLGARLKYLYGMENIYSQKSDISLRTDPDTYEITAKADIQLRTAGFYEVDEDESTSNYLFGRNNHGAAIDLGANYQIDDKWSASFSVIDLGFINWSDNVRSYTNKGGNFTYNGIELDAFTVDDTSRGETSFDYVLDSLEEAFELKESSSRYQSPLTTRVYLGGNYSITDRDNAGALVQTEIFQKSIKPSFTLSYSRLMTKWISLATSYTIIHRSYNNLGFGFSLDPGPVQFYIVTDNALGLVRPQHARHVQIRFGINLIFGREKPEIRQKKPRIAKRISSTKDKVDQQKRNEDLEKEEAEQQSEDNAGQEENKTEQDKNQGDDKSTPEGSNNKEDGIHKEPGNAKEKSKPNNPG